MSSNRGRIEVILGGPWRLYQLGTPPGWEMLGTVQRGFEIGAFARHRTTGNLVMMRAGAVSALDQRKATAAMDAARNDPR